MTHEAPTDRIPADTPCDTPCDTPTVPSDTPATPATPADGRVHLLRAGGVSLVIDGRGTALPTVLHWGADVGDLGPAELAELADAAVPGIGSHAMDVPRRVGLLPQPQDGYTGDATLRGQSLGAQLLPPRFHRVAARRTTDRDDVDGPDVEGMDVEGMDVDGLEVEARDEGAGLALRSQVRLHRAGVVALRHTLTNTGAAPYRVGALPAVLPVPARAHELLDLTGRHTKERVPQRLPLGYGTWNRAGHHGSPGHDAPLLLSAGTPGFGFRHGEVWAAHLAWSGDGVTFAERQPDGWAGIGGAELLAPGELELSPGEAYRAPWVYFVYSDRGLDGITDRLAAWMRARPGHPRGARPVVLNTWEAVYFEQNLSRLSELATVAAGVGVERFVLDDGWFGSRRDDGSGLGDWSVAADVWPGGLTPLIDHVGRLGMDFGLWVEPEMVNPDSDLLRAHPDWVLAPPDRLPPTARRQQALDLGRRDVYRYLLERLDALLDDHAIAYLKWDFNRDIVTPAGLTPTGRRPGVHAQTLALYRLLDELRARHPGVEIESCAGGGGRIDLEILRRTDRVWVSDCNDPLERQHIQRWTGLLLPPELMGTHVGPPVAHTTGRTASLDFRAGTALFGHFGIEWDLTTASSEDLSRLASWIAVYRRFRTLLHGGSVVRADFVDDEALVHGVVAPDADEAIFAYVQLGTALRVPPAPWRFPGLDPARTYRVSPLPPGADPLVLGDAEPPWLRAGPLVLPGSVLRSIGLPVPVLAPQQLLLVHVEAVERTGL